MKTTIRRKLLVFIITLLTLLYMLTGAATVGYVRTLLVEQADRNNRQALVRAMQQLDVVFQMGDMTARQVMTDTDIDKIISTAKQDNEHTYVILSRANVILSSYIALNPFVANIIIFTPDNHTLSNQGVLLSDHFRSREKSEWFLDFSGGSDRLITPIKHASMAAGSLQSVVTLAYKYKLLLQEARKDNYLMIDIPTDTFRDVLQINGTHQGILVVDDKGQTIIESSLLDAMDLVGYERQSGTYNLKDNIVLYERMDSVGWNLYYPIPRSEFTMPITLLLIGLACLYALVLLASIILLSRRIRTIVEPVHRITKTMQMAYNGNFDVYTDEHSGDEFEILSDCFNKLVSDLKQHIQKILEEEEFRKEIQMDLMMSQIHPHFIYNTLNSVVYLIEENDGEAAIDTVYALINILQSAVRVGGKDIFATIAEEIDLVKAYASIATVRYPDMFNLDVSCEERLLGESIPKVLIQPLVENAINHGIIPSGRPGRIWITISSKKTNSIDICVEDDGVGINHNHMEDVLSDVKRKSVHGIGLLNIRNRIQFLYNALDYSFEISERPGGGTKVYIRLLTDGLPVSAFLPEVQT